MVAHQRLDDDILLTTILLPTNMLSKRKDWISERAQRSRDRTARDNGDEHVE